MISPDYVRATGIPTFKLESPVGLQLTCMGSKSTINYGVRSSIVFGNKHVEEYFDVANIDHYDVILGTLFLWRLRITLDFTGQGIIHIGVMTRSTPGPDPVPASARPRTDPRRFIANALCVASRHVTRSRCVHPHDAQMRHGTHGP